MARTEFDHVTKVFAEKDGTDIVAVDDLSLEIENGEFLVLVGPSGCGKSTTLRMLAGLETVTDGEIRLDRRVINDVPSTDRDIAMVFQSYALYPHMTVGENMRFGLEESTNLSDGEIDERVERTAEMMNIPDLLDRKPSELSGGQQQRVALGRAIVRDPEVFLLDEPLSNLDAKLRSQMRTELQRLQENLGTTTIYVTHDQTEAMTMGDRIAILDDGELRQVGTPLECYHEPANLFVAGFIGEPSMNFFETTREGDRLVGEEFEYPLSSETADPLGIAERVTLGVRPEDVELVSAVETDHDYRALVDVVEPMGNENVVYLQFADGETESSGTMEDDHRSFVATVGGVQRVEAGSEVVARIPEDSVHLFDAETGEALRNRKLDLSATSLPNV